MKCPACTTELRMTEREGIEIDYCPQCRGVWLDRGELDKIIERSTSREAFDDDDDYQERQRRAVPGGYRRHDDDDDYREGYRKHDDDDDRHKHSRRRGGFWSNLFDFD